RPCHPLAVLAGTLALQLCLIRPILADPTADDPIAADSVAATSAHAAEVRSQREVFATVGPGFAIDFDVELFEAGLPHDMSTPAAVRRHPGTVPSKSAAEHPRNKAPAAKQPLRPAAAPGKPNESARTTSPAARKPAAAAPPATIPHARPRAPKPDHGPRELF